MPFTNWIKKVTLVVGITLFTLSFYLLGSQYTVVQAALYPQTDLQTASSLGKETPAVLGVFEGTTPCSNENPPMPHISADSPCEMMKWHIELHQDPKTGEPTTYLFHGAYGVTQANTTGIRAGGVNLELEGKWAILRGTKSNPDTLVYQLNPDTPELAIYLTKITDYLLHVSTQERTLMVGNGGWSYTLNRTDASPMVDPTASPDLTLEPTALATVPNGSPILGVFSGRTPCDDAFYDFAKATPDAACTKLKWGLHLNRDPQTGQPTTYTLRNVFVIPETQIKDLEGTWAVVRAPKVYPDAEIYQLNPTNAGQPLYFLKADDNHLFLLDHNFRLLVGDALWSYTLSKTE